MKNRFFTASILAILAAALVVTAVSAQHGPGGPQRPGGPMHPPVVMKATDSNVFMLLGPTLVKFDTSLQQQGTLDLIEPPTADASGNVPLPMPANGTMLLSGSAGSENLIIVIGDNFFRVDAASLTIKAQATLPAPEPPKKDKNEDVNGQPCPPGPMGPPMMPASLELHGNTLYVLRGKLLVSVNITDGSFVQATLPDMKKPEN